MSTATLASPAVTAFAAAVRAALSDLPAEEIDDLTDGLEADLTERLADSDAAELGDPLAYAEELRAAAGLPKRTPQRGAYWTRMPVLIAAEWATFVSKHPLLRPLGQFFLTLRPLWWVFRAAVVTELAFVIFGSSGWAPLGGSTVVVFLVLTVVSVQFGRGRWLPFAWMRWLLLIANILLIVATPFLVARVATEVNNAWYSSNYASSEPDFSQAGLTLDGNQVSNVFAYDAQGNPLTDVQLFDQDGKPLDLVGDPTSTTHQDGYPGIIVPNQSVSGRLGWNVYPLAHVDSSALNDDGSIKQSAMPSAAVPPFATAKPLAGSSSLPSPSASPSPSGSADASAGATASAAPSPAP
jgi:hypothetical protein